MDLIEITYKEGEAVVSARELYGWLKVKTPFRLWMPRMYEYGLDEGIDYTPYFFVHPQNGQRIQDFALTIDCAKEISMIQRTAKGKQARQYFIEKEKELRRLQLKSPAQTALALAQALVNHEDRIAKLEASMTTRPETYSIAGYSRLKGLDINLTKAASLGRKASKICRDRDIETDTTHDPRFGKVKVYPVAVLKEVFGG